DRERARLAAERAARTAQREAWDRSRQRLRDLEEWRRVVRGRVETLTYTGRRLALDAFAISAVVWRSDHSPRWEVRSPVKSDGIVGRASTPSRATTSPRTRSCSRRQRG